MHRIDHETAAASLFGAGKPGFTGGNTTTGVPSTRLTPDWCNAIQEEIARTIEAAEITLDASNNGQLADAILALASSYAFSGAWGDISGKPAFAPVATSGAYGDLSGTPDLTTLSYAKTSSDAWVEAPNAAYDGNINDLGKGGVFTCEVAAEATGKPAALANDNCHLSQFAQASGDDTAQQFLTSSDGTQLFYRGKWGGGSGGNWMPWYRVWHDGNDGAGSTLDADLLDGLHASEVPGAAKKYLVFDQANGNLIHNSLGVSSVTDHATGQYTVSFSAPWPYIHYALASCTVGDTGYPDCVVIEDNPALFNWTTSAVRMAHKVSGEATYVDGRPDTLLFAGM